MVNKWNLRHLNKYLNPILDDKRLSFLMEMNLSGEGSSLSYTLSRLCQCLTVKSDAKLLIYLIFNLLKKRETVVSG